MALPCFLKEQKKNEKEKNEKKNENRQKERKTERKRAVFSFFSWFLFFGCFVKQGVWSCLSFVGAALAILALQKNARLKKQSSIFFYIFFVNSTKFLLF